MSNINWESVIDKLQAALVWVVIAVLVFCTIILLVFDSLAGTGIGMNLTRGNLIASVTISLATTGLLTAVAFLAYLANDKGYGAMGTALTVVSVAFLLIDIYMDALGADILHYNAIVIIKNIPEAERTVHVLYRVLIGGLSTVGEPLALAIIVGMPVLKEIIENAIPASQRGYTPRPQPKPQPNQTQRNTMTAQQMGDYMAQERARKQAQQQQNAPAATPRPIPTPRPQPIGQQKEPTYHPVSYEK